MSLQYQKNGRYRFHFDRIINGQRIRATKLLPKSWNQKQAQDYDTKETAKLYALATGQVINKTVDEAVLIYIKEHAPQLKTFEALEKEFAYNLKHYEGVPITELYTVVSNINKLNISPASKRNYIANIRAACRYAWKYHNFCDKDPAINVKLPKLNNKREHYATRLEMLKIAKNINVKYRAFIRIAFYTGMRIGEMLKAKVIGDMIVIENTKNGTSRIIPIHDRVKSACEKYLPCKYAKITLQSNWSKARDTAKLNHLHFHDLRHSTASEMINNGVDLYTVGKILGHKDASSTQRYSHLMNKKLSEAVNKIGRKAG
jgi:integrase